MTTVESRDYARVRINAKQNAKGDWAQDITVEVSYDDTPTASLIRKAAEPSELAPPVSDALTLHDQAKVEMDQRIAGYNQIEAAVDESLAINAFERSILQGLTEKLDHDGTDAVPFTRNGISYEVTKTVPKGVTNGAGN